MPGYALMQQRFEAGHSRLVQIATMVPTVMFAAVAFVSTAAHHTDLRSPWLIASVIAALIATMTCWAARFWLATFVQVDPAKLYAEHLHLNETAFKADSIYWAGRHFELNRKTTERIYQCALAAIIAFGIAMACLSVWAVRQL